MGKIIELEAQNSPFLIESSDLVYKGGLVQATGHIEKNFERMLERIRPFCESIISNFELLSKKPTSASAEFGLSIGGGGDLFIVKASGEATIKITLSWT